MSRRDHAPRDSRGRPDECTSDSLPPLAGWPGRVGERSERPGVGAHVEGRYGEQPWIENRRRGGWPTIDFAELWAYRDLASLLAVRDFKLRYKQTVFGGASALVQAITGALIFTVIFGRFGRMPSWPAPRLGDATLLFVEKPRYRRTLLQYAACSLNGGQGWQRHVDGKRPHIFPRRHKLFASVVGPWLYLRSSLAHKNSDRSS